MTTPQPDSPPTLAQLITKRIAELKASGVATSYSDLAAASKAAGYPVSRATFHGYENNPITNIPPTDTLRGLAAALQVTPDAVLSASATSVGLRRADHQKGQRTAGMYALLADVEDRSPEQIAALESALRSVGRLLDAGGE